MEIPLPDTTLEDDAARARALADQLAAGPCDDTEAGETRCIDRENNIARKKGEGFTSYRSDRMCESCAAFWFSEMAALRLEHTLWLNRMLPVTDDQRSAG